MSHDNFNALTGLNFVGFIDDRYVIDLNIEPYHLNVRRIVHGGVLCTLLDTAMTRSYLHSLPKAERDGVTLEMKVNFLKAVQSGTLTAYGQLVSATQRTAHVEGHVEMKTAD